MFMVENDVSANKSQQSSIYDISTFTFLLTSIGNWLSSVSPGLFLLKLLSKIPSKCGSQRLLERYIAKATIKTANTAMAFLAILLRFRLRLSLRISVSNEFTEDIFSSLSLRYKGFHITIQINKTPCSDTSR